eukprot:7382911-Prymnesium_polylepis.2
MHELHSAIVRNSMKPNCRKGDHTGASVSALDAWAAPLRVRAWSRLGLAVRPWTRCRASRR